MAKINLKRVAKLVQGIQTPTKIRLEVHAFRGRPTMMPEVISGENMLQAKEPELELYKTPVTKVIPVDTITTITDNPDDNYLEIESHYGTFMTVESLDDFLKRVPWTVL